MENKYYNLGLNILALRKAYGKSQLEMAMDLNVKDNTISQYETGTQVPTRDMILKIAKYFRITENELIYGDFSNLEKIDIDAEKIADLNYNIQCFDDMFPIICDDEALKNENFKKAYQINMQVHDIIAQGKDLEEEKIDELIELYEKAYKEGVIEGIANILWWIMVYGYIIRMSTPSLVEKAETYSKLSPEQIMDETLLNIEDEEYSEENKEYEKEVLEYIVETEKDFFKYIKILKRSTKYSDLADYYIALRYIFGLYNNSQTLELNRTIGTELSYTLDELGNKYIKKALKNFK